MLSWEMEISTWRQRHPTPISSNNPTVSKYLQVWSFSILSPPCAHSNTVNLETSNTWIWNERNNRSTTQDLVDRHFPSLQRGLGHLQHDDCLFFSPWGSGRIWCVHLGNPLVPLSYIHMVHLGPHHRHSHQTPRDVAICNLVPIMADWFLN